VLVDWQVVELDRPPIDQVRDFMTADPVMVAPNTGIGVLARQMVNARIDRVIVVDERRKPIGVVSLTDIAAAVAYAQGGSVAEEESY
jgi:CBS domain-containing protein